VEGAAIATADVLFLEPTEFKAGLEFGEEMHFEKKFWSSNVVQNGNERRDELNE